MATPVVIDPLARRGTLVQGPPQRKAGVHSVGARPVRARKASKNSIRVELCKGTKRDAILYSVGANSAHGQRRTNEDKRRAATTLLNDAKWSQWSAEEIARRCVVSATLVKSIKSSLGVTSSEPRIYTNKHGTVSTMRTENIGRRNGYAGA